MDTNIRETLFSCLIYSGRAPGALRAYSGALWAHSGALRAHSGRTPAHSGRLLNLDLLYTLYPMTTLHTPPHGKHGGAYKIMP